MGILDVWLLVCSCRLYRHGAFGRCSGSERNLRAESRCKILKALWLELLKLSAISDFSVMGKPWMKMGKGWASGPEQRRNAPEVP